MCSEPLQNNTKENYNNATWMRIRKSIKYPEKHRLSRFSTKNILLHFLHCQRFMSLKQNLIKTLMKIRKFLSAKIPVTLRKIKKLKQFPLFETETFLFFPNVSKSQLLSLNFPQASTQGAKWEIWLANLFETNFIGKVVSERWMIFLNFFFRIELENKRRKTYSEPSAISRQERFPVQKVSKQNISSWRSKTFQYSTYLLKILFSPLSFSKLNLKLFLPK